VLIVEAGPANSTGSMLRGSWLPVTGSRGWRGCWPWSTAVPVADAAVRAGRRSWCPTPTVANSPDGPFTIKGPSGGLGDSDAELRDGAALTEWLVAHGLTGSRDAQLGLAREGLTERIRTLTAWAGVPARQHGLYCYESAARGLLLTESTEAILDALMVAPLSSVQLEGAADLFTCLEWTRPLRAEIPEPLRSQLIAHGTATGNRADALPNASRLRRRHHRLKRPANACVAADSGRCED
jgi:hypothetical protein